MKHDNDNRAYPPEWCSAETMAYLLDIGASTFRGYASRGLLPSGTTRGGSVRWRRQAVIDAWGGSESVTQYRGANDNNPERDVDAEIRASIKRHGPKAKTRH